ncbi:MAG: dipeptidase [Anaerolineales bacterium]|nr:dipeptidase [Anaerolineales bacterium]
MTKVRDSALEYAHSNKARFLDELKTFAAIPSVSTDPAYKSDIQKAASWAAARLEALGMKKVQIFPTAGHPVVYGETMEAGKDAPVVLFYGHYDVQPAEPLDLWESPAFEPTQRGENLYARGVSDMKGQILAGLFAIESIQKTSQLPCNLKFIFEGEEEIGSPNLAPFIADHKELLASDIVLNLDSGIIDKDFPSITCALRGLAYFEIRVSGAAGDLHSGMYGGAVHNPAQVLCELIAGMHNAQGKITLPGYYDSVRPLTAEDRADIARLPVDEEKYLKITGAPALYGEAGYTSAERIGARPTLEVNGLLSGFTGEGSKTVLPAKAMAKISMRLVPDQDPSEVHQQLLKYMELNAPPTVRWEVEQMAGGFPSIVDRDTPGVQELSKAFEMVWGIKPGFKREGGSVPVVAQMQSILGKASILAGFGLPDDNLHAPNEKLHLPTWYRGIDVVVHFLFNLQK